MLVMVALPVMAIVMLDTIARTAGVSPREDLDRQLGGAAALVRDDGAHAPIDQDPLGAFTVSRPGGSRLAPPQAADVLDRLPAGSRVVGVSEGQVELRTARGAVAAAAVGVDLSDPLARSAYRTVAGRPPRRAGEIAVSERLARRGLFPGAAVQVQAAGDGSLHVVGTVRGPGEQGAIVVLGRPGDLRLEGAPQRWLVERNGPIGWDSVRRLNQRGLSVLSRAVAEHPPPRSALPASVAQGAGSGGGTGAAVIALVAAMALLQVVLLAGPAFAVGARRQRHALALLAATGATPRDVRRVVLAGVVIGATAAVAGAVLGVVLAWLAQAAFGPAGAWGPFEVSSPVVALVAVLGLLSAVLAALGPARAAARADVLLGVGVLGAVLSARGAGEYAVAASAVPTVLGAVLLAPALLGRAGRLAHALPLPARLALRDAARQRSRTAPAVAAIAATVAGVVALGIGASSDAAETTATYVPFAPNGSAVLTAACAGADWRGARAAVRRELPGARVTRIAGMPFGRFDPKAPEQVTDELACDGCPGASSAGAFGTEYPVGATSLPFPGLARGEREQAGRTLAAGGAVLFADAPPARTTATIVRTRTTTRGADTLHRVVARASVPARFFAAPHGQARATIVLSEGAAAQLRIHPPTTALVIDGARIDNGVEDRIGESLAVLAGGASLRVERGPDEQGLRWVLLLLGGLGGALVLGGTLTATLLALSEAGPDFATLMAVGASPGIRRATAACYAGAIGLLGAVLGALAGFVPGLAVTVPLTGRGSTRAEGDGLPGVFVAIPWELVATLVIGVPLLAAAGVALFTRSRLPLTSRRA